MTRILNGLPLSENTAEFLRGDGIFAEPVGGEGSGDVTGPSSAVDSSLAAFDGTSGKLLKDSGSSASSFAPAAHNHDASYAAISHAHSAADITSGTIATDRLGSGTANSTTFLRGDQTYAAPPGGGSSQLVVTLVADSVAAAWSNMPLAATLFNNSHRHVTKADLTNFTEVRFLVNKQATAGAAASTLSLVYSASFATTAAGYSQIGTSAVQVAVNVQNAVQATGWIPLVAGAKADVFLAVVGAGGDGVLDPTFGVIAAQFR